MELISVQLLADRLLIEHELFKKGWRFSFDRAKRRAGCCRYSKKEITLAKVYAEQEEFKAIKNVIGSEKSPIIGTTKANTIERLAKIRSRRE